MDKPLSAGRRFWRSLEERMDSEEFRRMMRRDHPDQAADWLDPVTRRRFLALLGASLGLAGLAGCGPSQAATRERSFPTCVHAGTACPRHPAVLRHRR